MYSTAPTEVQFSVALIIIIIIITKHYKTKKRQNICGQKYKLFNGTLGFNNDDKTSSDYQTFSTQRNIWKMAQQHNACSQPVPYRENKQKGEGDLCRPFTSKTFSFSYQHLTNF